MRSYPVKLFAGKPVAINVAGDFIKCEVSAGAFSVTVDNDGKPAEFGVEDWWQPTGGFSRLVVLSLIDQDVVLKIGRGQFGSTRIGGDVKVNGIVSVSNVEVEGLPIYYGMAIATGTSGRQTACGIYNPNGSGVIAYLVGIPAMEGASTILVQGGNNPPMMMQNYVSNTARANSEDSPNSQTVIWSGRLNNMNMNMLGGEQIATIPIDKKDFSYSSPIACPMGSSVFIHNLLSGASNISASFEIVEVAVS
jgi:hypothetical protein